MEASARIRKQKIPQFLSVGGMGASPSQSTQLLAVSPFPFYTVADSTPLALLSLSSVPRLGNSNVPRDGNGGPACLATGS